MARKDLVKVLSGKLMDGADAQLKMTITQDDIINVAVSEQEERLNVELKELAKTCHEKMNESAKLHKLLAKESKKLAEKTYGEKLRKNMIDLHKMISTEKLLPETRIHLNGYIVIDGRKFVNCSSYSGSRIYHLNHIPFTKSLIKMNEKYQNLIKEIGELHTKHVNIEKKLKNVESTVRKMRAQVTKSLISKSDLDKILGRTK